MHVPARGLLVERLGQGSRVALRFREANDAAWWRKKSPRRTRLCAQVDGEAFTFDCPGETIEVAHAGVQVATAFGPLHGRARQGPPASGQAKP